MGLMSKRPGSIREAFVASVFYTTKNATLFVGIFHSFPPRLADCGAIAMPFMMAQFLRDSG